MKFREMLARNQAYLAPAVFNPLSAKLAKHLGLERRRVIGTRVLDAQQPKIYELRLRVVRRAALRLRRMSRATLVLHSVLTGAVGTSTVNTPLKLRR